MAATLARMRMHVRCQQLLHAVLALALLACVSPASATKEVLFVAVAGHTPTIYIAATAAELVKQSMAAGHAVNVRLLCLEEHRSLAERYLNGTMVSHMSSRKVWTTNLENKAHLSKAIAEDNFKGIANYMFELAKYYEQDYQDILKLVQAQKPDLMVIDVFANSATDLAEKMGIPHMTMYHPGILGIFGIEDSFAMPDVFTGTLLAEQGFKMRLFKILQLIKMIVASDKATAAANQARARLGLPQYGDPSTHINGHPIIATLFFGLDHARPVSPLTRLVGAFSAAPVDPETFPQGSGDAIAHEWLSSSDKPVLFASFGTETYPPVQQLRAILKGGLAAGTRVLMLVRQDILDHYGLKTSELKPASASAADVLILPWLDSPQTAINHPTMAVFVCHGGIQSTIEGINAGVPLIVIPENADRNAIAARVVDRGVGVRLDQNSVKAADVVRAVRELTHSERAADIRQRMARLKRMNELAGGGAAGAARYVSETLEVGYEHLVPITHGMNPFSAAGLDVVLLVLAVVLVAVYVKVRVALWLVKACCCGRRGQKAKAE